MTIINIQEEIQKAMLDDAFVQTFAAKLRKALAAEDQLHDPETLDITLNVDESNPTTFILNVADLYTDQPVVTATNRESGETTQLTEYLTKLAVQRLREAEVAGEGRYWAGLVKVGGES